MKTCPFCQAQIDDSDKFCGYCGQSYPETIPPVMQQPIPAPVQEAVPVQERTPVMPEQGTPVQPIGQEMQPGVPGVPGVVMQPGVQMQPTIAESGGSRGLAMLVLLIISASPFLKLFEAGAGKFEKDFSSYDMIRQTLKIADFSKKISKGDGAALGLALGSFLTSIFFLIGFVGIIAGFIYLCGAVQKIEKFWRSIMDAALGVFIANGVMAYTVLAVDEKSREYLDISSLIGKNFRVKPGLWIIMAVAFLLYLVARSHFSKWRKLRKANAQVQRAL